jgi:hypothetical protein
MSTAAIPAGPSGEPARDLSALKQTVPGSERVQPGTAREVPGTVEYDAQVSLKNGRAQQPLRCRVAGGYARAPRAHLAAPIAVG